MGERDRAAADAADATPDLAAEALRRVRWLRENRGAVLSPQRASRLWTDMDVRTRFRIVDTVVNFAVIAPLTILFWFGSWGVIDRLYMDFLPRGLGALVVIAVGGGIEFAVSYCQRYLSTYTPDDVDASYKYWLALTRFYNFALGFANIMHYRGILELWDMFFGLGMFGSLQAATTSTLLLWGLRCGRNILGPPLSCAVDTKITSREFFEVSTYRRSEGEKVTEYMIDTFLTVAVVTSLIDLHIIGLGAVFDNLIFPNNVTLAIVSAWILGYTISAFAISMQDAVKNISHELEKKDNEWSRLLFEDCYFLFCNIGVVLVWKGHWQFFDALSYYFPVYLGGYDITPFAANGSAFALMALCHASSSLVLKGCDIDGEQREGAGCELGISFFAEFFSDTIEAEAQKEEERKLKREAEEKLASAKSVLTGGGKKATGDGKSAGGVSLQGLIGKKTN